MINKHELKNQIESLKEEIKEISIFEDLTDSRTVKKIAVLKNRIQDLQNELDYHSHASKHSENHNAEQKPTNNGERYYETMSVTYIDDNGAISEVYRINEEIVTKEAFDDWSYDYFNVIKKQKELEESENLKNEISDLEQKLLEKKDLLNKKGSASSKAIPDIRESQSSKFNLFNKGNMNNNGSFSGNINNSKFFKK